MFAVALLAASASAATKKKLHNFLQRHGRLESGRLVDQDAQATSTGQRRGRRLRRRDWYSRRTPRRGRRLHQQEAHNFGPRTDGTSPSGGLIFDAAGNLTAQPAEAAIMTALTATAVARCSR